MFNHQIVVINSPNTTQIIFWLEDGPGRGEVEARRWGELPPVPRSVWWVIQPPLSSTWRTLTVVGVGWGRGGWDPTDTGHAARAHSFFKLHERGCSTPHCVPFGMLRRSRLHSLYWMNDILRHPFDSSSIRLGKISKTVLCFAVFISVLEATSLQIHRFNFHFGRRFYPVYIKDLKLPKTRTNILHKYIDNKCLSSFLVIILEKYLFI